jgi:hypothetical protein
LAALVAELQAVLSRLLVALGLPVLGKERKFTVDLLPDCLIAFLH